MAQLKRLGINFVAVSATALPLLLYKLVGEPTKRGFFVNDESLAYPYHESTVPSWLLYLVGFGTPISLIIIHYQFLAHSRHTVWSSLEQEMSVILGYLLGAAASHLQTDICKYTVGRLRPHFFQVCAPIYDLTESNTSFPLYVTNYTCGNIDEKEVHLSFPSGHASFAFQSAVFSVLFLQSKKANSSSFLLPFLQIAILSMATFTAVSRVMDYKHHPTDVLAGSIIGTLTQIVNVLAVTKLFDDDINEPSNLLKTTEERELSQRRRSASGANYNSISKNS